MRTSPGYAGAGRGRRGRDALGALAAPTALPSTSRHWEGLQKCETSSFWWPGRFGSRTERSWDPGKSHSPGTEGAWKPSGAAASAHALLQPHSGDPGPTSPRCSAHVWPWPGCVRSRASRPCCGMRLLRGPSGGLREGKLMARNWG